jgi:hypothetical protein
VLPPHPPANRKISNGTPARSGRALGRKAAAKAEARRIELKGPLKIQVGKAISMIAKMRKEKARLC